MKKHVSVEQTFYHLVDQKENQLAQEFFKKLNKKEQKSCLEYKNSIGETPLLLSARLGCADMVAILLDFGADIRALDEDKGNVFHNASLHSNCLAVFQELFAKRDCEELLIQISGGQTAFERCASRYYSGHTVEYLIEQVKTIKTLESFEATIYAYTQEYPKALIAIQNKIKIIKEQSLLNQNLEHKQNPKDKNPTTFKI